MMMMDPDIIKVKLVELKLFPERNSMDSDDPPPECSTQMKLLLKEVKAIILAKGAAKFIDFVEVIVKQEQYDELGNHMIGKKCNTVCVYRYVHKCACVCRCLQYDIQNDSIVL